MSETRVRWFYHFWPWFIVLLLGVSVLASLTTVFIAVRYGDTEVDRSVLHVTKPGAG